MPYVRPGIRRLFDLMLRRREMSSRDVGTEVSLHLELRVEQLVRRGLTEDDARREAERRFGSIERALPALEEFAHRRDRQMTFRDWLDSVAQDVRYALRGLRREPAFTAFAVITLALGIGANAAMYGVVDRLLLRGPDHVVDSDQLYRFTVTVPLSSGGEGTWAYTGYVMYQNLKPVTAFQGVAAYATRSMNFGRGREATSIPGGAATANFFSLLGVRPLLGRFFTPDEDDPGAPARVAVLGELLWRNQFGGDRSIVGRTVTLNQNEYTVIGVAPRGFTGVELARIDVWTPMSDYSRNVVDNWPRSWNAQWLMVVARLKDGVSSATATSEATRAHLAAYDGPPTKDMAKARIGVAPIRFTESGKEPTESSVARWLLGVTMVVLLIACSNVANLLLARAIRRRSEVGVRLALGASRRRLARLFVTESLVLATLGGLASLLVATTIAAFVRKSLLTNIEWTTSPVNSRVLLAAFVVTLLVGLLVGCAPAIHAARGSLHLAIQRGRSRIGVGAWPTVLQATMTACLLIGAGLFVRSLHRARTVPLGFESERVLVSSISFVSLGPDVTPAQRTTARARNRATLRRALERLQEHPGVEQASIAVGSPFGNAFGVDLFVPGYDSVPNLPGGGPYISAVTADYFRAVGTRLVRGRTFNATEGDGTEPVVIVNETMARTLWPQQDALSRCLKIGADTAPCAQVVGIVEDARRYELKEPLAMQYYIPFGQERGFGGSVLMIRPRATPAAFKETAIRIINETDATIDRALAWPIRERIDPLLRPWKLGATVFTLGGVLALLVAVLGLYSVMSYSVAQRTHEMGIRIALGARTQSIVGMIVRQGVIMAGVGVAAGIMIAYFAGRRVQGLLFDTSPNDVPVIAVAATVLLLSALLASFWPALRAGRVDPMRALKSD